MEKINLEEPFNLKFHAGSSIRRACKLRPAQDFPTEFGKPESDTHAGRSPERHIGSAHLSAHKQFSKLYPRVLYQNILEARDLGLT